jgi:hypothetical protein
MCAIADRRDWLRDLRAAFGLEQRRRGPRSARNRRPRRNASAVPRRYSVYADYGQANPAGDAVRALERGCRRTGSEKNASRVRPGFMLASGAFRVPTKDTPDMPRISSTNIRLHCSVA